MPSLYAVGRFIKVFKIGQSCADCFTVWSESLSSKKFFRIGNRKRSDSQLKNLGYRNIRVCTCTGSQTYQNYYFRTPEYESYNFSGRKKIFWSSLELIRPLLDRVLRCNFYHLFKNVCAEKMKISYKNRSSSNFLFKRDCNRKKG